MTFKVPVGNEFGFQREEITEIQGLTHKKTR